MRSLSPTNGKTSWKRMLVLIALFAEGSWTFGCSAGVASSPLPPPLPPPPSPTIAVTVNPMNGSVVLGGQATFTATVTNTTDTAISWSVSGMPGGNATLGTISSAATPSATRAGRHCKHVLCLRSTSASRLEHGQALEENLHFLFSILAFLFSDFVWCEPASTKQKSRTERGKKDWPALTARLLCSASQNFVEGRAARG
jgi:hypothetical protein